MFKLSFTLLCVYIMRVCSTVGHICLLSCPYCQLNVKSLSILCTTTLSTLISDLPYPTNVVPSFYMDYRSSTRLEASETFLRYSVQDWDNRAARKAQHYTASKGIKSHVSYTTPLRAHNPESHYCAVSLWLSEFRENITLSMARGTAQTIVIGHFDHVS